MDEMIPLGSGRYHVRKFQAACYSLAPNFGKTAGVLKIPIEAAGYENAKGFSEIGRRVVGKCLVHGRLTVDAI